MTDDVRAHLDVEQDIDTLVASSRGELIAKHAAREAALPRCREVIQLSANVIRAVHRLEFDRARELLRIAGDRLGEINDVLVGHADIYHAGFVHDAQKEYAEACLTLAFVSGHRAPDEADLGVGAAAYLNGLAEAASELRRHLLDTLRRGDVERCESLLGIMDDVYAVLITIDYPDAITGGLRRTTDQLRGVLERTRGDLTVAVRQQALERKLDGLAGRL